MILDKETMLIAAEVVGPAAFAIMGFFIRSYFRHIERSVAKIGGQLESMRKDLRDNTVEIVRAMTEVKALWRYIDGAHERASDINGGSRHE